MNQNVMSVTNQTAVPSKKAKGDILLVKYNIADKMVNRLMKMINILICFLEIK